MNEFLSNNWILTIKNLKTHIPTRRGIARAVDGVSFSLEKGKTLGIVGESGCGKSVLCRTILKLLPRHAGIMNESRICFNNRYLENLPEKAFNNIRGRDIAMIFQDPMSSLNPVMKIGRQIAEPLARHLGMKRKPARERAVELLTWVGIPDPGRRVDQYPHQLSGGLRQRAAIAIALAAQPQLLIADEPTTALDVTVQAEILDLLEKLQAEKKMSIILITHDLGVAADRSHDIAVMYAGKILEHAPASKIFENTRHPYTKALTDAIPRLDHPPHTILPAIDGRPPDLTNPPPGCRFAPRCRYVKDRCQNEEPVWCFDEDPDHGFACWHPLKGMEI